MQREKDVRRYIDALIDKPVARAALRKLVQVDSAEDLRDLASPGNRLKALEAGRYGVQIDDRYRICFRWKDGHPFDVEITDK